MALPEMTDEGLRLTRRQRPGRERTATGNGSDAEGLAGYQVRRICLSGGCDRYAMDESALCRDCWAETEALEAWLRERDQATRRHVPLVDRVTRYLMAGIAFLFLVMLVRNLPGLRAETFWP